MKIFLYIFLAFVFFISPDSKSADNDCKLLGDNLYNCSKYECNTSSPTNDKNIIHHKITGVNQKGDCVHEQVDSNGEKIVCEYSGESRKFLALKMKKAGSDLLKIENSDEFDENVVADIFENECKVYDKNNNLKSSDNEVDDQSNLEENENYTDSAMDDDRSEQYKASNNESRDAEPLQIQDNGDLTSEDNK